MSNRQLIEFLTELGAAMSAAGDATTFITRALERIGRARGLRDLRISSGPTLLLLRYSEEHAAVVDLTVSRAEDLRLDQVSEIYRLLEDAEMGYVNPQDGLERLHEILEREPRFGATLSILGLVFISGGISLVLGPSMSSLLACCSLGIAVGVVKLIAGRVPALWPVAPVVSAAIVTSIGILLIHAGLNASAASLLLPPLAVFLPAAAITVAMIELSAGDIVAGGSRLAFGMVRLLLLVLGIVIAAQTVNVDVSTFTGDVTPLTPALQALGVIAFTCGVYLHFCAPRSSFFWLLIVVGAAWGAQRVSDIVLGSYLSAALAGAVMVIVARLVASRSSAPPLIVSYTPAFWLLVPTSLGLRSLTQLAQGTVPTALSDLLLMILIMLAIALGMLLGLFFSGYRRIFDPT